MIDWLWQHIFGAALNGLLTSTWGLWVIVIVAGAALGVAWRILGWKGLLGAGAAAVALLVYRRGRKDQSDWDNLSEHVDGPDADPPQRSRPKPKSNPDPPQSWWDKVRRGERAD